MKKEKTTAAHVKKAPMLDCLDGVDVEAAILKTYEHLDLNKISPYAAKKRIHSAAWHHERERCFKIYGNEERAKNDASNYANSVAQNWATLHKLAPADLKKPKRG